MTRLKRPRALCAGLVVCAVIVAGCGSSSSSSSSPAASSPSASSSSSTSASTPSSSSSSSSSSSGTITSVSQLPASGLARAQAGVALFTKHPTQIPVTQPVGKPIPSGKTIDVMNCGIPYCNSLTTDAKIAGSVLGWKVVGVLAGLTPESIHNAWVQVVKNHPDAVIAAGYPSQLFSQQLAQLKAANIPVAECCISEKAGNGIDIILNPTYQGAQMAWWAVTATHGKGHFLYGDNKDYPIIDQIFTPEFKTEVAKTCPACTVDTIDIPSTAYGTTAPSQIVSYLRGHPNINYIVLGADPMDVGLPQALSTAGLHIPFEGDNPDIINQQYIANGQEQAGISFPGRETEAQLIDALARIFTHQPVTPDLTPGSTMIIDKANDVNPSQYPQDYINYLQQFKKLWGK